MAGHTTSVSAPIRAAGRFWPRRVPGVRPSLLTPWTVLVSGALAAATVGYLTAQNPSAAPADVAVPVRMVIVAAYATAAAYARRADAGSPMTRLLTLGVPVSALWLLNGAAAPLAFSVGVLFAGLAPVAVAYLLLAHPTGRLHSQAERRLLIGGGGVTAALWFIGVEISGQPPLRTPLITCAPHCRPTVLSLDLTRTAPEAVTVLLVIAWLAMSVGTAVLIHRRDRAAAAALHRSLAPVDVVASAAAILLVLAIALRLTADQFTASLPGQLATAVGLLYATGATLIPLAVLLGLSMERLFMARTLARLVRQFATYPEQDPRVFIAQGLEDPTLQVAYLRPETETYVDATGMPMVLPLATPERSVSWIRREGRPVAAVIYDRELSDKDGFLEALGAAALIRLERAQLEAELRASSTELAESRVRLLESADAERRRLERDLHDGVQQDLIGLRIKLGLAVDAIHSDPGESERQLEAVGRHMDEVLQTLRDFARGIYPAVLQERGLADALRSAAAGSPAQVSIRAFDVGRYPQDVEVAIYFCCLEALQNVAKHAGADVPVTVKLSQRGRRVYFEVRDFGCGFDMADARRGSGLTNMQDRIEALGGRLVISSSPGRGATVKGSLRADGALPAGWRGGGDTRGVIPFG